MPGLRVDQAQDITTLIVGGASAASPDSLRTKAATTFALRLLAFGIAFIVNIVVSRALGAEGRGQYALTTLSALTIVVLAKLGVEHANVYLVGTIKVAPNRLAQQNALLALGAGVTGATLLLVAPTFLPGLFQDVPFAYLAVASAAIPFLLHAQLAGGLQAITGRVTWQFRAAVAGAVMQLVLVGGLVAMDRLTVVSALLATLVANVVTWLVVAWGDHPRTIRMRLDIALLRSTLRYSLIVHVGLVLLFLQTRLTLFLVQLLVGTEALGQYSLAVSIAESLPLAADSLAIAALPRQTSGTLAASAALGLRAARLGGLLTLAAAVPLALFGSTLIVLVFGSDFQASYVPLIVLLPGAMFLAVQRFCGVPALRANQPIRFAGIFGLGVAISVLLNLWWIPEFGLLGAAASTTISYALTAVLFVKWARTLSRVAPGPSDEAS